MKLSHIAKVTAREVVKAAKEETKGCSPFMRMVALSEARTTLKDDHGIVMPMRTLKRIAKTA